MRDAHAHASESLRQQVREAQGVQLKMRESMKQYEGDVQKALDQVVSQALARDIQLRASLQSGHGARAPADPALEQQLKQALAEADGDRQTLENLKYNANYKEERAAHAEVKFPRGGLSKQFELSARI